MSISMLDIMSLYGTKGIWAVVAALFVFEFSPVKWRPLTHIFKVIGKALTADLADKITENEVRTCRYRIIRFDDEIRHHQKHSHEHFNQIIEDIDMYERYCRFHPEFPNSKAVNAIKNIKQVYDKCLQENSFL